MRSGEGITFVWLALGFPIITDTYCAVCTSLPSILTAAKAAKSKLIRMAIADKASPLYGVQEQEIIVSNGRLFPKNQPILAASSRLTLQII
ncbi:MAG: hypothetical protein SAK29_35665 [Scytonema sp. PMC 1069.18]|nr:hypothetical protein [Scytonema sp. PMC 1069.18]MEC4888124.1 hypothetical protein [Scytonema sp. PMC 1070.18]